MFLPLPYIPSDWHQATLCGLLFCGLPYYRVMVIGGGVPLELLHCTKIGVWRLPALSSRGCSNDEEFFLRA